VFHGQLDHCNVAAYLVIIASDEKEKTASGAVRRAIQLECYFSSFVSKGIQRIKRNKETSFFHVWWRPFTDLKVFHLNIQIKLEYVYVERTCLII
jgi:hypothetical protein